MKFKDFEALTAKMIEEETKIGKDKGIEYTQGGQVDDRLSNFKKIGDEVKCVHCGKPVGPLVVLWVYMKKHLDSVLSYINRGKTFSDEPIEGRIKDVRVYCSLLRGLIQDEREGNEKGNRAGDVRRD